MKKLIVIIFLLLGYLAQAQTVGQFRYDTTKFLKVGGRNHVMIENLIQVTDSTYKALVIGPDGVIKRITYWPGTGSGGGSDTTNLHGRGVAYYQLEGDSAVLTLNDSSKYSVAIGGGGGAEKYITAGYGVTVDSSVANVYEVGVDTATVLEITNPRPAYHIFGNHTGSSAAPTWGKLNVNSINATGTPSGSNALLGNGTWGNPVASAAGSANDIQFNTSGVLAADTSFKFNKTGVGVVHTKKYASFKLASGTTAQANSDTIVGMFIKPSYSINGKTSVKTYDINIGKNYISLDSLYNYSISDGSSARPTSGHLTAIGFGAGSGASSAEHSIMIGRYAGLNATNANRSNFFGSSAGFGATSAASSNFFGSSAGVNAINAANSNFFGTNAGNSATSAANSNFFGNSAGQNAINASNSNFFGTNAGKTATNAANSNFFGNSAGQAAINASNSNFFGNSAGQVAINASNSNFFGYFTGQGTQGAYQNFFGSYVGDSSQHKITGANNILIGLNITTPVAASTNTMSLGNVLYGTNFYGTVGGAPSKVAQTNGQIGINVATPDVSAALDVKSTIAGFLPPRMTQAQRDAISSPADGLIIFCTDCTATDASTGVSQTYSSSAWRNHY